VPDLEAFGLNQDWKEFEAFVDRLFVSFGFDTRRNFRLRKPAMEIDLIASKGAVAFAIDCKHWKRTVGNSSMTRVSAMQISRAQRILETGLWTRVIPVIMTLRDESLFILQNGVPIVPVSKLFDFILNWEESAHNLLSLTSSVTQSKII
jgi:Holliday junction resolvase-like predicted endonuclease